MKCEHDLAEQDTAIADGMCPLCLASELAKMKDELVCKDVVIQQFQEFQDRRDAIITTLLDERKKISDSIRAKTDSGEVPDNLAQCVEYLMLKEYYPMRKNIDKLTIEIKELRREAQLMVEKDKQFGSRTALT